MRQGELPHQPRCPTCDAKLDGWTALEEGTGPTDGDVTLCIYCGTVMRFQVSDRGELHLLTVSEDELAGLLREAPLLASAQAAVKRSIRDRRLQ